MNYIIENLTWMAIEKYVIGPSLKWVYKSTRRFRALAYILFVYVTRRLWPERIQRSAERAMVCLAVIWLLLCFNKVLEQRRLSALALA